MFSRNTVEIWQRNWNEIENWEINYFIQTFLILILLYSLVPSQPPDLYYVQNISSSALNVSWNHLNDEWTEGPLKGYMIYFRPSDEHILCNAHHNCTTPNSTFVNATSSTASLYDLKLNYDYTVWMAACTSAGEGPLSVTLEAATDYFSKLVTFLILNLQMLAPVPVLDD